MLSWILVLLGTARASLKSRNQLALENLALRQQLAMLRQSVKRPRVTFRDRLFWILYSKYVSGWRALLHTLHPDHLIVVNQRHLRRTLRLYLDYYHTSRMHLPLNKDPLIPDR